MENNEKKNRKERGRLWTVNVQKKGMAGMKKKSSSSLSGNWKWKQSALKIGRIYKDDSQSWLSRTVVESSCSRVAGVGMKDKAFLTRQLGSSFQNHKYAERLIQHSNAWKC